MKIITSLVNETISENTAVTVGKFDGIHKGHELLTEKLRGQKEKGLASCVLTFDVSPRIRLKKDMTKLLITNAGHIFWKKKKSIIWRSVLLKRRSCSWNRKNLSAYWLRIFT